MFHSFIHYITTIPASTWYHLAAFILTGAGAQYSVQLVKVIASNKYGKGTLRFLNGLFSTLYVAAGALMTGGISVGNVAITSSAIATLSVLIYRLHNSVLYKGAEDVVNAGLATSTATVSVTKVSATTTAVPSSTATPASSFAE